MNQNLDPSEEELRLRRAIAARPASATAHAALASFLCAAGRPEEALAHADRQLSREPSRVWPLSLKAGILTAERRAAEAIEVHRVLVAKAPDVPLLWANFASDLAAIGQVRESAAAYRRAVELAPEFGAAWLGLANLGAKFFATDDITRMERGLPFAGDPHQRVQQLLALGRAHDATGAFERAFAYFSEANRMREGLRPYERRRLGRLVEAHGLLRDPFFADASPRAMHTGGAIFIVGMPRSGSTLIEQILGSHPDIEAAGELFALADVAASLGASGSPDDFVHRLEDMTRTEADALGKRYLAAVERYRRTDRRYFTDKMPANWRFIALIHRILPDAPIIDVRRDALACCFSIFTNYFNHHTDVPNSLEDLGEYYRCYAEFADGMRNRLPHSLYCLEYERLISRTEREVRALLEFLGLPFSPTCLSPHEYSRAIYTPSAQQVRVPIGRSDDRWRNYAAWLSSWQDPLQI